MIGRVFGDSLLYGGAMILSRAASVVSLLVLPSLLTPSDYGALGLVLTLSSLLMTIGPLEITQGLVRFYPTASSDDQPKFAATAFYFTIACFAGMSLLTVVAAGPLTMLIFGSAEYRLILQLGTALITLNGLFYFVQGQFRWEFRARDYALVSILYSFLTVGLSVSLAFTVSPPLIGVILGQILAGALVVILAISKLRSSFGARFDGQKLRSMLHISLPIVPAVVAIFINTSASRLMLQDLGSLADVGQFTFAWQIAGIGMLAIVGMQAALTPLIMAHHADPQTPRTVGRLFEICLVVGVGLALILGLFAPEAIAIFADADYRHAGPLVILLAPAMIISQMYIFFPGFLIAKKTVRQLWVSVASAVVCVAANALLIPAYGISGAAVATLAASILFLSLWIGASQPLYAIPVRWIRLIPFAVACLVAGISAINFSYPSPAAALIIKSTVVLASAVLAVVIGLLPLNQALSLIRHLSTQFKDVLGRR